MHVLSENKQRFQAFIRAYKEEYPKYIEDLRKKGLSEDVPIITDETRDMIRAILCMKRPKDILELGTAIAYSTIVMAHFTDGSSKIYTVENNEDRVLEAKSHIKKYDKKHKIKLYNKDIDDFLKQNKKKYDFIFLDAAKAQYITWLPYIKKAMKKGCVLLADNILKDGDLLESRYTIRKRDRTIHKRMREYIYDICHDDKLDSFLFDIGDGIALSIKK